MLACWGSTRTVSVDTVIDVNTIDANQFPGRKRSTGMSGAPELPARTPCRRPEWT